MDITKRDGETQEAFEARQRVQRQAEGQVAAQKAADTKAESAKADRGANLTGPVKPKADPVKELSPQGRLEALLVSVRSQVKHNAPVSPSILAELESIVAAGRADKRAIIRHDFAKYTLIPKDSGVTMIHTVEEGIDFVRALPDEVRARPHWLEAERRLLLAIDSSEPSATAASQAAFEEALAEDRRATPLDREPDERLPDGRVRDDRFAERRLVAPVPQDQPQPVG